jgi:hypothetical protein
VEHECRHTECSREAYAAAAAQRLPVEQNVRAMQRWAATAVAAAVAASNPMRSALTAAAYSDPSIAY